MKRVYVGLSGGVDSSVAAAILKQQGYTVTGVYMKNWTRDLPGAMCPWQSDLNDARAVAAVLDIPFKVFDFESQYHQKVVEYMIDEYKSGRTPNPDVMCNQEIKFKLFLDAALADGADLIATGHYASIENGRLCRGVDESKDQTYFLYRVNKQALQKSLMPIGRYKKSEVRKLAADFKLPTADKKDSQGICFVGPVGMRQFLEQYVDSTPGPIIDKSGQIIGQHSGVIFYTIGQRQGLGVGGGKPFYVTSKDMHTNTVFVTDNPDDLLVDAAAIELEQSHWINEHPVSGKEYLVRFRHRGELVPCRYKNGHLEALKPVGALASGQSAVVYDSGKVLGGGIINSVTSKMLQYQR